jgi:hypothetical protein
MMQPSEERVYFVSGHLDLTASEFLEHYAQPLYDAVLEAKQFPGQVSFIVCDAPGTDAQAQEFLGQWFSSWPKESVPVTVYHMLFAPRNNERGFRNCGGFTNDLSRDEHASRASTHDIAWVRPGKRGKSSGTQKNLDRREEYRVSRLREERSRWPKGVIVTNYDGPEPVFGIATAHAGNMEKAIPIPPDLKAREEKAWREWQRCQMEIVEAMNDAIRFGDGGL